METKANGIETFVLRVGVGEIVGAGVGVWAGACALLLEPSDT